jgi:aldose 1-epimerase
MHESVTITDVVSGASAQLLPSFGFNCFSFQPIVSGRPIEVLWCQPEFGSEGSRPSHSGIPLLFPFAGRLRGQELLYRGNRYSITRSLHDGGHAIHGFVLNRPWRIVDQSQSHITGAFQASVDDPELVAEWPADYAITVTYAIELNRLSATITVENPDDCPLPFSLATHPYFRVPLMLDGDESWLIDLPARRRWELTGLLPTGRSTILALEEMLFGTPVCDLDLDDVFSNLVPTPEGTHRVRLVDPVTGTAIVQTFDPRFDVVVAYTPPHREAISLEPQLAIPNPFELEEQGIITGLQTLEPGERFSARIIIEVESEQI